MSLDADIIQLRQLKMFRNLDMPKLKLVAVVGERVDFVDGEAIFSHGDPPDSVFIVLSGAIGIHVIGSAGLVQVARNEGAIMLGESGLLCDHPRTLTILADGPVAALRIPAADFMLLLHDMPGFALAVMTELARQLDVVNGYLSQRAINEADAALMTGQSEGADA
jgi:CRP-like cAMP-binding protein